MNNSVDLYLSKQENIVVEFIRRTLQAETKITLLESALQESNKQLEETNTQLEHHKTLVSDVLNTLKTTTIERDTLKARVDNLTTDLEDYHDLKLAIETCRERLNTVSSDYSTLQNNYQAVVQELVKYQPIVEKEVSPRKKAVKKPIKQDSEWSDGE
jgi:chromosome segregation ATPase